MNNDSANLETKPTSDHLTISDFDSFLIKYLKYIELSITLLVVTGLVSLFCIEVYFYDNHNEDYQSVEPVNSYYLNNSDSFDLSKGISPDTIKSAAALKNELP